MPGGMGHPALRAGCPPMGLGFVGGDQGVLSSTSDRSPSGCTGRLLASTMALKAASYASDISIGVVITFQATPSEQGGVVSEPA